MNIQPTEIDIIWLENCIKTASSQWAFDWCEEIVLHLPDDELMQRMINLIDDTAKNLM